MTMSELEAFAKNLHYYGWGVESVGATALCLRGADGRECHIVTLDTDSEHGPDYVDVTIAHDRYGECAFRSWPLEAAMGSWINGVVDGFWSGGKAGYNLGFHVGLFHQMEAQDKVILEAED